MNSSLLLGNNSNSKVRSDSNRYSYSEDPANFDADSYEWRIWCGIRIGAAFVIISLVQLLLAVSLFTAGIVALWPLDSPSNSSDNQQYQGVLAFERWPALIYFRVVVALVLLLGLGFGFMSVVTLRSRYLLFHLAVDCIAVFSSMAYVALLAWHCAVERDYFAFCFVGLSLLAVLLVNVLAAHCAIELLSFLKALHMFLEYAQEKWPNVHVKHTGVLRLLRKSESLLSRAAAERSRVANRRPLSGRQSLLITQVIHESPDE